MQLKFYNSLARRVEPFEPLVPGRRLVLCGCEFESPVGLLGHSDADAPTHALMDALLGAAALGDIGHLFPDTDPEWEGADSVRLLEAVVALVKEHGWQVGNVDITIALQRPKLAPHIPTMRETLAPILGVPVDAVSVKATTMEKLGPIGAREGIAAQAVALLESVS